MNPAGSYKRNRTASSALKRYAVLRFILEAEFNMVS